MAQDTPPTSPVEPDLAALIQAEPPATRTAKDTSLAWIAANADYLSAANATLWGFAEPSWREYRSAAWYVAELRRLGFEVEAGSAGMPTAFCARYGKGSPVVAAYAEYDAVPGNSQQPVPYKKPRAGVHPYAAGHTDPHSALGVGALGGLLAAKAAMDQHQLPGTLVFFGEPAEKMCGSKPIHASHGYYDGLDAALSFHPMSLPALANTALWDTHCGCYWSKVFTFECTSPETWATAGAREGVYNTHATARAPAALDAVCLMYTTTKYTKEAMLPHTGSWTLNEAILGAGQATADNLPPPSGRRQDDGGGPQGAVAGGVDAVLENNARHVAGITHCRVKGEWVTKTRPGLANHAMAAVTHANFQALGPPRWGEDAKAFGRQIQENLGLAPMAEPFIHQIEQLITPWEGEALLRQALPPWQQNYTSDDYTDYTWHAPTVRFFVGRPALKPPVPGHRYPQWVHCALGGLAAAMDPMILKASQVAATTVVDLLTRPEVLAHAKREFDSRTGGGIRGEGWLAPLLGAHYPAPIHYPWPEYVTTPRGEEWTLPTPPNPV